MKHAPFRGLNAILFKEFITDQSTWQFALSLQPLVRFA
jgi:hypothetical protein